jgi:predicted DNA-binding transcriptional regulator YafY
MNRIERLLGIVTLLQTKKFIQTEAIAAKYNISVRTVYRDVKALCEQGVPVSFEPGKGYFIVQGFFLPPVSFTTEEAAALLLMETMVHGFTDKSISRHYSKALNKIKSVLRSSQKEAVELLHEHTRFQFPACFYKDTEYLSVVQSAIVAKQVLELEYANSKGETSRRKVEPVGMVFYAFSWHLIGWCRLREEYRDFKVSRIMKMQMANEGFTDKDHISLNTYMQGLPVNY